MLIFDAQTPGYGHACKRCFIKFGVDIGHQPVAEPDKRFGDNFSFFAITPGFVSRCKKFLMVTYIGRKTTYLYLSFKKILTAVADISPQVGPYKRDTRQTHLAV